MSALVYAETMDRAKKLCPWATIFIADELNVNMWFCFDNVGEAMSHQLFFIKEFQLAIVS